VKDVKVVKDFIILYIYIYKYIYIYFSEALHNLHDLHDPNWRAI